MVIEKRIKAFHQLGEKIKNLSADEKESLFIRTANENPWFTPANVGQALTGIAKFLDQQELEKWCSGYSFASSSKKVGVAMAGNIPLVGFHDLLCVILSGHQLVAKLSSNDSILMNFIKDSLINIDS